MHIEAQSSCTRQATLKTLIRDLRVVRGEMVFTERQHRSGVLAGQLLLLALEYQHGHRPSRRRLRGFLRFVCDEKLAA